MVNVAHILKLAKAKKLTIGAVESLTGGLLLATLTSVSGASKVIKGGLVTYTREEKEKLLHISHVKIAKYGVISEQVAFDMAKMGRYRLNVDICVALTGNAGPKVMEEKPRGLYYLAIATPHEVQVIEVIAAGTRTQVRRACVTRALEELENTLLKQVA